LTQLIQELKFEALKEILTQKGRPAERLSEAEVNLNSF